MKIEAEYHHQDFGRITLKGHYTPSDPDTNFREQTELEEIYYQRNGHAMPLDFELFTGEEIDEMSLALFSGHVCQPGVSFHKTARAIGKPVVTVEMVEDVIVFS